VLDLTTLEFEELTPEACGFAYRRSIFNSTERGRYIVTRVDYQLVRDGAPRIAYADLKKHFAGADAPSLVEVSAAVRNIRHAKGMLIIADDPDCRSAGSFFKNPVISAEHYSRIAAQHSGEVPRYPAPNGEVKLPAAWLLDQAGFHKGYTLGRAGISSRHTLALVNKGQATAADILALRDRIAAEVEARFGIRLEPEPVWLGPRV
jgi:UDP-N-acetylmuramate dehydrogenase